MAFRLASTSASTPQATPAIPSTSSRKSASSSCASSDSEDDQDDTFEDWQSDSAPSVPARALFGGKEFKTVEEAAAWDIKENGVDFVKEVARLGLDFHERVRLVNYIRKESPSASDVLKLSGSEPLFKDDALLIPVLENDPFLQFGDDSWDSSDDEETSPSAPQTTNTTSSSDPSAELLQAKRRIRHLEEKLKSLEEEAREELGGLRNRVKDLSGLGGAVTEGKVEVVKEEKKVVRDDDSHYFDSYAYNDIHEIMLKDTTRTKSYALFILSNPHLFKDAIVLDVGCGTGILSLLAARAGAKHVYAVDASDVAKKAIENIKVNGLADRITVVRGKVEDIELPVKTVDIIISEWMGYFLLYESMLDSVLVARDRFLREGGVMAPSQTKIMLSGVDCADYIQQRVGFWSDVYGFDMRAMAEEINEDSLVEVLEASEVATSYSCIKDILISTATVKSLDFTSSFSITATKTGTMHAFLGHFDTFFTPDGSSVAKDAQVDLTRHDESLKVEAKEGDHNEVSFTTGPAGVPTHWKQTLFLLKEPIAILEGTVITGVFHCHKSSTNSRELDVEIHYQVANPGAEKDGQTLVQLFKVR